MRMGYSVRHLAKMKRTRICHTAMCQCVLCCDRYKQNPINLVIAFKLYASVIHRLKSYFIKAVIYQKFTENFSGTISS